MHTFLRLFLPFLALLAACAPRPARAPVGEATSAPAYEVVRRNEVYAFKEALANVHIVNRFGDLRVRMAKENSLGVSAVIQRIAPYSLEPELRVVRGPGRIDFSVEMPGAPATGAPDLRRGRVDLVVFVPNEASLDLATEAGRLEVRHAFGPVRARTGSGVLAASSRARLDLASRSGLVQAGQLSTAFAGRSTIASETGDVQLAAPDSSGWQLRAQARGGFALGPGWMPGAIAPPPPGERRWTLAYRDGGPTIVVATRGALLLSPVAELPPD
jgi:hypothetical protein